jgi:hypothetical protein
VSFARCLRQRRWVECLRGRHCFVAVNDCGTGEGDGDGWNPGILLVQANATRLVLVPVIVVLVTCALMVFVPVQLMKSIEPVVLTVSVSVAVSVLPETVPEITLETSWVTPGVGCTAGNMSAPVTVLPLWVRVKTG